MWQNLLLRNTETPLAVSIQPGEPFLIPTLNGELFLEVPLHLAVMLNTQAIQAGLVVRAGQAKMFPVKVDDLTAKVGWMNCVGTRTMLHLGSNTPPLPDLLAAALQFAHHRGDTQQYAALTKVLCQHFQLLYQTRKKPTSDFQALATLVRDGIFQDFLGGQSLSMKRPTRKKELPCRLQKYACAARQTWQELIWLFTKVYPANGRHLRLLQQE